MRRSATGVLVLMVSLAACNDDVVFVESSNPAPPLALAASYYAGSVNVSWELSPSWNGEPFRVYSRRVTDRDWFFIAEVTSCAGDFCTYEDINVVPGQTYEYLVSAVGSAGGETDSEYSVEVFVPEPIAPPIPDGTFVIALDNANYVTWGQASLAAEDFSFYRVYFDDGVDAFLLGETDSEGFLDLLAGNGQTYSYFVTAVDFDGHESEGSRLAEGTPRPDYSNEWIYDFADLPGSAGFRFSESEDVVPIVDGSDPSRHFRLESDPSGWWLVPGPDAAIYPFGFETSALKCGVAADADCVDVSDAPTTGYVSDDVQLVAQQSYVLRVVGDDGLAHYGIIRVNLLGLDGDDNGIMIFDWAYQLQANNPSLVVGAGG